MAKQFIFLKSNNCHAQLPLLAPSMLRWNLQEIEALQSQICS
jgi:hypothetical protein